MNITTLDEILLDISSLKHGQPMELSTLINLRHKLTTNIDYNLYNGGNKEEGRKALEVRGVLDNLVFNSSSEDLIDENSDGLTHLKNAITLEILAEQMQILEGVIKNAKKKGMKNELINLLADPDKFSRFIPSHQEIIKAGATGFALLANRRINKVRIEIGKSAQRIQRQSFS